MVDQHTSSKRTSEQGNVLFFILIAVVLLGVLTAVLSRSSSTVDQSADYEQQTVRASQIVRYAKSIEAAVQEMQLRGISERDISFANTVTTNIYTNGFCDDDTDSSFPDCLIFDQEGAGLTYLPAPNLSNDGSDWLFVGTNDVTGVGTTDPDLIMILPIVRDSVCTAINRLTQASYGATESAVDFTAFTGTYTAEESIDNANGQTAGCIDYDNGGTSEPFFYMVLIQR